jgi:membrane protease YdiL (CAAX protease family)
VTYPSLARPIPRTVVRRDCDPRASIHRLGGILIETDVQLEPQSQTFRPVASYWHTAGVLALIAILSFLGKLRADQLRTMVNPDRVAVYGRTILFEWLLLGLVLVGVWLKGASLLEVLGNRWHSVRQFLRDAGIGMLFLIASIMVSSILGSHGGVGDKATQFLLPHGGVEMAVWVVLSITAGICEEAVYRGYLQRQFMALTKSVPAGIVISALAFGAAHSYQGFARASVIGVIGAMGGILAYWVSSVRPGMIGHALQDILGGIIRH